MSKYTVTVKMVKKHKKIYTLLLVITYIIFLPIVLLQVLNDLFENFLNRITPFRMKIVNGIFKIFFKNECHKYEKELEGKE